MFLILRVIDHYSQPVISLSLKEIKFSEQGGQIGRPLKKPNQKNNDYWGLPDRYTSSPHAEIKYSDNVFYIIDLNSRNGTFLQDTEHRLSPGQAVPLNQGDKVIIGDHVFEVWVQDQEEILETSAEPLLQNLLKGAGLVNTQQDFRNIPPETLMCNSGILLKHLMASMQDIVKSYTRISNRSMMITSPLTEQSVENILTQLLISQNLEQELVAYTRTVDNHQAAMIEGMYAAIKFLAYYFEPEHLKKQAIDQVNAAKYRAYYQTIFQNIQQEPLRLVLDAFIQSYEKRVRS